MYPSSPELAAVPTSWSPRGTVVLIATTVHKTVASNPAARTHLGMYILLPGLASICSILFTCQTSSLTCSNGSTVRAPNQIPGRRSGKAAQPSTVYLLDEQSTPFQRSTVLTTPVATATHG